MSRSRLALDPHRLPFVSGSLARIALFWIDPLRIYLRQKTSLSEAGLQWMNFFIVYVALPGLF